MSKSVFTFRRLLLLGFLLGSSCMVSAQDAVLERAQHIYELFVAGQGDSIHARLNKKMQEKVAPALFSDPLRQAEAMFGKLQSQGEWQKDVVQGIEIYYCDLKLERYTLRFLLAFDADGCINTIRLMPAPAESTPSVQAQPADTAGIVEREITVGAEGFRLPGTLTLPRTASVSSGRKLPCVILVHGSGPNDRDETIGPNKPFRDIAYGLARRGIAVIRYDKRTKVYASKSAPQGRELDYDTEATDDAVAAVAQAKSLPQVAADSIYVLGHSLGGTLAPRIAQRAPDLAGIIILAGLARPLEDTLLDQYRYIFSLTGSTPDTEKQLADLQAQMENVKKLDTAEFDEKVPLLLNVPASYWRMALAYKPVEVAAELKLPILVLQGERDYQVTMEDFGLWRFGLLRCKNAVFKSYPKLNHLMQEGIGKATPMEYNRVSPVALYVVEDIAEFVRRKSIRMD